MSQHKVAYDPVLARHVDLVFIDAAAEAGCWVIDLFGSSRTPEIERARRAAWERLRRTVQVAKTGRKLWNLYRIIGDDGAVRYQQPCPGNGRPHTVRPESFVWVPVSYPTIGFWCDADHAAVLKGLRQLIA